MRWIGYYLWQLVRKQAVVLESMVEAVSAVVAGWIAQPELVRTTVKLMSQAVVQNWEISQEQLEMEYEMPWLLALAASDLKARLPQQQ
jgi:hypothetical protein